MQRIQNIFHWTLLGTLMGHMLCCGLPTFISIVSVLSGIGVMATMPMGLELLHDAIHAYETPLIIFSGFMVVLGWVLHEMSRRMDCRDTGCGHPPCKPKKKRSRKLLAFATFLFFINAMVYFGVGHSLAEEAPCKICLEAEKEQKHLHEHAE